MRAFTVLETTLAITLRNWCFCHLLAPRMKCVLIDGRESLRHLFLDRAFLCRRAMLGYAGQSVAGVRLVLNRIPPTRQGKIRLGQGFALLGGEFCHYTSVPASKVAISGRRPCGSIIISPLGNSHATPPGQSC